MTRPDPSGLTAPLVAVLYAIPELAAPLIPLTAALALYRAHRYAR